MSTVTDAERISNFIGLIQNFSPARFTWREIYLHNRYGENSFAGDSVGRNEGATNRQRDLSRSERRAHLVTLPVIRVQ